MPSIQSCGIGIPLQVVSVKSYTACSMFLLPACNISTGMPSSPGAFLVLIWSPAAPLSQVLEVCSDDAEFLKEVYCQLQCH